MTTTKSPIAENSSEENIINEPKKRSNSNTVLWHTVTISSFLACLLLFFVWSNIHQNSLLQRKSMHINTLGYEMKKYSDQLTSDARTFAVTNNVKSFEQYWDEIILFKNRERILSELQRLNPSNAQQKLLMIAKRKSDELMETELHSMKLVLLAYQLPTALYPEQLTRFIIPKNEIELTNNKKVLLAQQLLFDRHYAKMKAAIMAPITQYNTLVKQSLTTELSDSQTTLKWLLLTLTILIIITTTCAIGMLWSRQEPSF